MSDVDGFGAPGRRRCLQVLAAAATAHALPARAAGYPDKPVRLIVPSAAGGSPDMICRILAEELGRTLGQAFVVDNKPGAGGAIGMSELVRAAPDGYTIGYGNVGTLAINRSLFTKLPYDPETLTGIALTGTVHNALVVRNGLPVKSVRELIEHARARPGKLMMGSAGNGTTGHLGGELFKALTGSFIVHVPYRGSPAAIQDLIGGQIDLMFDNLASAGPHIQAGRVRALGVSGPRRSALYPELPTIQEAGVKGYETTAWGGLVGPPGLSVEIVALLNREVNRLVALPAVRDKYAKLAVETLASPPSLIMTMAKLETPRWAEVIKRSGAKIE
ncbi:tripartite tricarboxylate transporter substrate binding protein [Aquincola sp. S2]|uniref:Tripartite tricarboxylate transporter substrate binding protein n=1 Tax=Pseudaquabacterium terrae TaxID=2732868 RepID=A0ABX2EEI5_9BURK|nr:tripartite tricarboxylate transporter substrate binding protein [Aquabacterium terrae]NRF67014.1 tripartite tricarboxylate transporter substrate binding protein [Aquabacterium terrae]